MVVGIAFSAFAITFSIAHFQIPVADFTGMPRINGSGTVCLRETSVKKAKKARSLSPPSGVPRRIVSLI